MLKTLQCPHRSITWNVSFFNPSKSLPNFFSFISLFQGCDTKFYHQNLQQKNSTFIKKVSTHFKNSFHQFFLCLKPIFPPTRPFLFIFRNAMSITRELNIAVINRIHVFREHFTHTTSFTSIDDPLLCTIAM